MAVNQNTTGWQYVTLISGGLSGNAVSLYPEKSDDDIAGIAKQWFSDNTDILYRPSTYEVGTVIRVKVLGDEYGTITDAPAPTQGESGYVAPPPPSGNNTPTPPVG